MIRYGKQSWTYSGVTVFSNTQSHTTDDHDLSNGLYASLGTSSKHHMVQLLHIIYEVKA